MQMFFLDAQVSSARFVRRNVPYDVEYRIVRKDASVRHLHSRARLEYDDGGKPLRMIGATQDVTESKRAVAMIRAEGDRAQSYLDVAGVMLLALDCSGKVVMINRRGCEILGCDESAVLGKDWFAHFLPADRREAVRGIFDRLMRGDLKSVEHAEDRVVRADGSVRTISWHNAIVRDSGGAIAGTLSSGGDITERKRTEEALAESERYHRALLHSLHEDIVVLDRDYRITDLNNGASTTTGLSRAEILGRHCHEVFHGYAEPCNDRGEDCGLQQVFAAGRPYNCHHRHHANDGSVIDVDILLSPMKDAQGNVTHVIESMRDVTDLFEAQRALEASE